MYREKKLELKKLWKDTAEKEAVESQSVHARVQRERQRAGASKDMPGRSDILYADACRRVHERFLQSPPMQISVHPGGARESPRDPVFHELFENEDTDDFALEHDVDDPYDDDDWDDESPGGTSGGRVHFAKLDQRISNLRGRETQATTLLPPSRQRTLNSKR